MLFSSAQKLEIEILVLPQSNLNQIAAVLDPMRATNRVVGKTVFSWRIVTESGAAVPTTTGVMIHPHERYEVGAQDTPLFICASYDILNKDWRALTKRLAREKKTRTIAGIETGAWLMAAAGLLNTYPATTHWEYLPQFAETFHEVTVENARYVISEDRKRLTTGGSGPTLDMMIHIIRARHGLAVANEVADLFVYDVAKIGQLPQLASSRVTSAPLNPRVAQAIALMETHIEDTLSVDDITQNIGISARQLRNLFHQETGQGVKAYYLGLRLHAARRLLLETKAPLVDIAAQTGFANRATFGAHYRQYFQETPQQTRKKMV